MAPLGPPPGSATGVTCSQMFAPCLPRAPCCRPSRWSRRAPSGRFCSRRRWGRRRRLRGARWSGWRPGGRGPPPRPHGVIAERRDEQHRAIHAPCPPSILQNSANQQRSYQGLIKGNTTLHRGILTYFSVYETTANTVLKKDAIFILE